MSTARILSLMALTFLSIACAEEGKDAGTESFVPKLNPGNENPGAENQGEAGGNVRLVGSNDGKKYCGTEAPYRLRIESSNAVYFHALEVPSYMDEKCKSWQDAAACVNSKQYTSLMGKKGEGDGFKHFSWRCEEVLP